jgi:replication fork clamp-binding protein CrfC
MEHGGFQQFIPMIHPRLTRRLERLVATEMKREVARLRRRHEQRQKRKKSSARSG